MGRIFKGEIRNMKKKVYNGHQGTYVYEDVEESPPADTETVTFRLSTKDLANLKTYLYNIVHVPNHSTIENDYYSHYNDRPPVDLSNAYRVISNMAAQISPNYPIVHNHEDDR